MKQYFLFRPEILIQPKNYNTLTKNGIYFPTFYFDNQYKDLILEGEISMKDMEISEEQYITEKTDGVPMLRRFGIIDYTLSKDILDKILEDFKGFNFQILTSEESIEWIKRHTTLEEVSQGKFLLNDECTDMTGEIIPAKYLILD